MVKTYPADFIVLGGATLATFGILAIDKFTNYFSSQEPPALELPVKQELIKEVYSGKIIANYLGPLPVSEDHPWKKCWQYGFVLENEKGEQRGFAILDYEQAERRRVLEELAGKYGIGSPVTITPTGAVFSLTLDRIIEPANLKDTKQYEAEREKINKQNKNNKVK